MVIKKRIRSLLPGRDIEFEFNAETMVVTLQRQCTVSGEPFVVAAPFDAYQSWKEGAFIQDVMPDLSAEQREFLISNSTPKEWDDMDFEY